jgi:hypothetical protein
VQSWTAWDWAGALGTVAGLAGSLAGLAAVVATDGNPVGFGVLVVGGGVAFTAALFSLVRRWERRAEAP